MSRSLLCRLVLVVCVLAPGLAAASEPPEDRPKIGLALSGGGAKGCAHVGVIEVLEEMNIPIDYVAGTSMGSIVGGLYASGMTVDEMKDALLSVDWTDAFNDQPNRKDLSFRRKEDDARYLFDFQLGLRRGKVLWPTGLISGQKLFFILRSLTLPVSSIDDFDELPVPFRAVATDIESGEMVVLDKGDLARALRASMALPGIFSSVDLDGRRLVDGGVVNNLPIDIVRAMGADIVIAVDLSPDKPVKASGMVQILGQTTGMITRSNVRQRLPDADLVLEPAVEPFGLLAFEETEAIIEAGAAVTRANADALRPYAVDEASFRAHLAARPIPPDPPATLDYVQFRGAERVDDRIILAQMKSRPGDPLDLDAVAADIGRIFGLGDFSAVDASLVSGEGPNGEIEHSLVIDLKEKEWGPNYLQAGLQLESDFEGDGFSLGILTNLTMTHLNARGAEWRTDFQLGRTRFLLSEFYQPLDFR
ncbi:MAG: patatin-like phospholipase family protein, partial [Acidobacteriota bacterium]